MRANEFIKEAQFKKSLRQEMIDKGYKFLGQGQEQDAYLEPKTGLVLKIFGTGKDSTASKYTKGQQSFIDFADFCMKNQGNPFLPQFFGWERFEYAGKYYLQIRVERMFDAEYYLGNGGDVLEMMADEAKFNTYSSFSEWYHYVQLIFDSPIYRHGNYDDRLQELVMLIGGEQECELLWSTMRQLAKLAKSKGYVFDLHSQNFMLGGDGEIIISDPFWAGSFRYEV